MSTTLIEVRPAKAADAAAVASTHDEAWRSAYQGIIPGAELEKLINRRGPQWWDSAIRKGSRVSVLVFGDKVAGYANYGRNRARSLHFDGEIYELYLRPEFQGLGFGRRLFAAARRDLMQSGLKSMVVWALSENDTAVEFYRALGGRAVHVPYRLTWALEAAEPPTEHDGYWTIERFADLPRLLSAADRVCLGQPTGDLAIQLVERGHAQGMDGRRRGDHLDSVPAFAVRAPAATSTGRANVPSASRELNARGS